MVIARQSLDMMEASFSSDLAYGRSLPTPYVGTSLQKSESRSKPGSR